MPGYPAVGAPEIDDEHAAFESMLRRLCATAEQKDAQAAANVLGALLVRAAGHFASEERLMLQIRYVHMARHTAAHRQFLAQARTIHNDLCNGGLEPAVSAWIAGAPRWFNAHVEVEDLALGEALIAARAGR
ncbi:MAG TPA: hemerythrin family protein [Myxococcales bacterium]|nr:hemerythrin family protein [Myxococcales bacterium]